MWTYGNILSNHRCDLQQTLEAKEVKMSIYFKFQYQQLLN